MSGNHLQTFSRPETDRKGDPKNFKTRSRGSDYPYDRTNPDQAYGQPGNAMDRSASGVGPGHAQIVPKDIRHSAWEDMLEAMGTPMLLTRGATSQIGSSVPGMGGFSKDPPKAWDDEDDDVVSMSDATSDDEIVKRIDPSPPRDIVPLASISFSDPRDSMLRSRSPWDELLSMFAKNPYAEDIEVDLPIS